MCDETVEFGMKMKGMRARAKHAIIKYKELQNVSQETCNYFGCDYAKWMISSKVGMTVNNNI